MCAGMYLVGYRHLGSGALEATEGHRSPQAGVTDSCAQPEWVSENNLRSSAGAAASSLHCWTTSSLPSSALFLGAFSSSAKKMFSSLKCPLYSLPSSSCRKPTHSSVKLSEFLSHCSWDVLWYITASRSAWNAHTICEYLYENVTSGYLELK